MIVTLFVPLTTGPRHGLGRAASTAREEEARVPPLLHHDHIRVQVSRCIGLNRIPPAGSAVYSNFTLFVKKQFNKYFMYHIGKVTKV